MLLLSVGCRKPAAGPEQPAASPVVSEDAQRLPAFDMSDGSQEPGGVPFERFYVELGDAPVRGPATAPV